MKHHNYLDRPYVHHVPVGNSGSLLLALEPHTGQNNESRLACCLKNSQKNSADQDAGKVGCNGVACQNSPPADNVEGEVLCNGNSRNDPVCRIFDNEDRDVDTSDEPGIL